MGQTASAGMESFCLTGTIENIDNEVSSDKVFDKFVIPKLENSVEKTESLAFFSSNYSYISLITKLNPSPDWFIGIQSFQVSE
jgi:hypothetical protein